MNDKKGGVKNSDSQKSGEIDIVIIDDDESMCEGCRQTLEEEGFRAIVAREGTQGLKMVEETHKIMHAPDVAISATCVRVPVYVGHSEVVHVEFAHPISVEEAKHILTQAPGVKVMDDPAARLYPVGRIRQDASHNNGLVLWIVSDNLRKGAALNTVQIAEEVIRRGLTRSGCGVYKKGSYKGIEI